MEFLYVKVVHVKDYSIYEGFGFVKISYDEALS